MMFDFSSRFETAFGFAAVGISKALLDKGFDAIVGRRDNPIFEFIVNDSKFDEVTLSYGKENWHFGFGGFGKEADWSQIFATPPMLSLKRAKKLVVTPIDNSDIEVVERYATEPYDITWKGLLIDIDNHQFPLEKIKQLNQIFEINGIWNVASEILNACGIQALYFKDISIEGVEGYEDTASYSFATRAIKPLEYQLTNK
jgi:hypothetical protein